MASSSFGKTSGLTSRATRTKPHDTKANRHSAEALRPPLLDSIAYRLNTTPMHGIE